METSGSKRIDKIVGAFLCTACGACSAICPTSAIHMQETKQGFLVAVIDEKLCISCGKCIKVCPSNPSNDTDYDCAEDRFQGRVLEGWIGYSKDQTIRKCSQSGGIVTSLLSYLLSEGEIDGAIVNSFNSDTNRSKAVLAINADELLACAGSYYSQTPIVEEFYRQSKADSNLATVVLGCQAEAFRNIQGIDKNLKLPYVTIGLVCAGQNSGLMIDELIRQSGLDLNNQKIKAFRFRDKSIGGWPGDVCIKTENTQKTLPQTRRHKLKPIFESYRCIQCFDKMNIYSDIVCGDPWGIEYPGKHEGLTVVVARTEKGQRILADAEKKGFIVLDRIDVETIMKGQAVVSGVCPRYYSVQNIALENNWLYPYKLDTDSTTKAYQNKKKIQELRKRMGYSRKFAGSDLYLVLIWGKKIQSLLKTWMYYGKKGIRRIIR